MTQQPTQVAVWVAVQGPPATQDNDRDRPAKRPYNLLLDPLEQVVAWLVRRLITPERGQKYAARLGLPGARQNS